MIWWQYHKSPKTHKHHTHETALSNITIREEDEKAAKCLCIRCQSETEFSDEAFQRVGHYPGTQTEVTVQA